MHHGCVLSIKHIVRLKATLHRITLIHVAVQRAIAHAAPPQTHLRARTCAQVCVYGGAVCAIAHCTVTLINVFR